MAARSGAPGLTGSTPMFGCCRGVVEVPPDADEVRVTGGAGPGPHADGSAEHAGSETDPGNSDAGDGGREAEPAAAVQVFGDRLELARRYVAALATDGIVRGLMGPREAGRLWSRHVLNSAVVAELIEPGARVVDIGSGAGLPGIPMAIARPDCWIDLVEPLDRRAYFLREMLEHLDLARCRVVRGRAEEVIAECGGAQVVTSRALAPLHRVAVWSAPLIATDGWMLALKGQSAGEELERDRTALQAAGLVDAVVVKVGDGVVDPPTAVVRARRRADPRPPPRSSMTSRSKRSGRPARSGRPEGST